jgi:hypothetical protein
MANSTDVPAGVPSGRFRVELDGGEVVEADGGTARAVSGELVPALTVRVSRERAHELAHLLDDWSRLVRRPPGRPAAAAERSLVEALESVAAAVGEPGALRCASAVFGGVTAPQRLAAVGVLAEREGRLSAVQRVAVVDAAARWLGEEAGEELAYALLSAVCSTDATTNYAYLALLSPPSGSAGAAS